MPQAALPTDRFHLPLVYLPESDMGYWADSSPSEGFEDGDSLHLYFIAKLGLALAILITAVFGWTGVAVLSALALFAASIAANLYRRRRKKKSRDTETPS